VSAKRASIISVGNELLSGETVDTNTSYLSGELAAMGVSVVRGCTVRDEVFDIAEAMENAAGRSDIVLVTGGLGPTEDDVTRDALARFLGVELQLHEGFLADIRGFFERRGVKMAESNIRQAYLPAGAEGLGNSVGTAPGIAAQREGRKFFCMPGVPSEMRTMFAEHVAGRIRSCCGGHVVVRKKVMCFGLGESTIADRLGDMMSRGRNPEINSTADVGVVTLHIIGSAQEERQANDMVEADRARICDLLGEAVYGYDGETPAEVVGRELRDKGKTVAIAESCTGGLVAKLLTDAAGASDYFKCGWITYSNAAKVAELGVGEGLIKSHGAVSEDVCMAMAEGARLRGGADLGVAVTGIAGPGGGSEQKPVGTVYICVSNVRGSTCRRFTFGGNRDGVRMRSALWAIQMLWEGL
jgi:nicotinamide-nucleotide amidase